MIYHFNTLSRLPLADEILSLIKSLLNTIAVNDNFDHISWYLGNGKTLYLRNNYCHGVAGRYKFTLKIR